MRDHAERLSMHDVRGTRAFANHARLNEARLATRRTLAATTRGARG
jgi:hypothetical protein